MSTSIATSSLLVEVSISTWTARKLDRSVTAEVNSSKHANSKASRVNKNLLPGVKQLDDINKFASAVRNWVAVKTLPWSDYGPRLVPTIEYFEFKKELDAKRTEFYDLVDAFLAVYPTLINAQQFQLGSMFKRDEYPPVADVAGKFAFNVTFSPMPTSGDFRIDIGEAGVKELQEQYAQEADFRVEQAMGEVKKRLLKAVSHMSDRMSDDGDKRKVFHGTILDSLADSLAQIRALNITRDEVVDNCVDLAERAVDGVDVELLKDSHIMRSHVKKQMDSVLDMMGV